MYVNKNKNLKLLKFRKVLGDRLSYLTDTKNIYLYSKLIALQLLRMDNDVLLLVLVFQQPSIQINKM